MKDSENRPLPKQKILIVEDNPKNIQLLGKIISENGLAAEFAITGGAALEWLSESQFDLILLDINLPDISGYEVCRKIRSDKAFNHTPVIFLTAETDRESILKGFEIGAQDYVTKPFDSRELIVRMRTHLALKDTLQKLEVEKEKAQSADNLKSAFLASMSHELRTPLNSIIGFTGVLLSEKPGPINDEQKKQLGMVQTSSRHLLSLINDILDISKIEAGQLVLNIQEFRFAEVLSRVIEIQKPFAEKKNISLKYTVDEKINIIRSDMLRVQQILLNLINNAVKFTDSGSVTVNSVRDQDSIKVMVTDTGIGIAEDKIALLFKPFFQIESGLSRKYEGTGLGLSICKKLTVMLGGSIFVESRPGSGSVFTVILPLESK